MNDQNRYFSEQKKKDEDKDNSGMVIGGVIIAGVGILFLLVNFDVIPNLGKTWPIFLVILGIALLAGGIIKRRNRDET